MKKETVKKIKELNVKLIDSEKWELPESEKEKLQSVYEGEINGLRKNGCEHEVVLVKTFVEEGWDWHRYDRHTCTVRRCLQCGATNKRVPRGFENMKLKGKPKVELSGDINWIRAMTIYKKELNGELKKDVFNNKDLVMRFVSELKKDKKVKVLKNEYRKK
jgi:hypothetical protein